MWRRRETTVQYPHVYIVELHAPKITNKRRIFFFTKLKILCVVMKRLSRNSQDSCRKQKKRNKGQEKGQEEGIQCDNNKCIQTFHYMHGWICRPENTLLLLLFLLYWIEQTQNKLKVHVRNYWNMRPKLIPPFRSSYCYHSFVFMH